MKQKITLLIIAGIAVTAGAWKYGRSAPAAQKWEYVFQTDCSQGQANGLGAAG
jgi:hypothetical protein